MGNARGWPVSTMRSKCNHHWVKNPWNTYALPRMTDRALNTPAVEKYRRQVVGSLSGVVVEIGFGSGLNVPLYPSEATKVIAIEPSLQARRMAAKRLSRSPVPVEFLGLDGQDLPLPVGVCDSALSTFTLCTIPDAGKALREIRRVLRPGGLFAFVEHGLSRNASTQRWQHRLNTLEKCVAGGCNLGRKIDELITTNGFEIDWLKQESMPGPGAMAPWGYVYYGTARRADESD